MTSVPFALTGQTLDGKYRITRMIGKGGMGAVHEAEHLGTGRTVAIKTILPTLVGDSGAMERFRREARAAGRLRHPNIVDVTDFGVARCDGHDVAYLAMEYLEGTTLQQLIRSRGTLPVDLVVAIVEQIALALEVAHRVGVVHRDLKPDNVWLVPDPRGGFSVRVLDFGIAKLRDAHSADVASDFAPEVMAEWSEESTMARSDTPTAVVSAGTSSSTTPATTEPLTVAGTALGTPAYMSPEQCRGGAVDPRSDIYSLGVIAYEALSGSRPFRAPNLPAMISAHLHDAPPPLGHNIPPRVAAVVLRALAKSPDERFQSATAMAGSLYAASEGPGVILRRSIALYVDRFVPFLRVSLRASLPGLVTALILIVVSAVEPRAGLPMVLITSMAWSIVTFRTNAAFAVVIDQLRRQPLEVMTPREVAIEIRRRLDLDPHASGPRTFLRLVATHLMAELRSTAGAGDLAFLIRFLESCPISEVPARCATLARTSRRSYNWIRGAIFAALFLPPLIEAAVLFTFFSLLRLPQPHIAAVLGAAALIPVNAMFVNPIFSSALALLYFRARQANGEEVGLASVVSGRL